ncbi:MAG: FAD-binding protein [Holosporales bacterium]|nr:FAD-binding protein [Holosporales bacterium]
MKAGGSAAIAIIPDTVADFVDVLDHFEDLMLEEIEPDDLWNWSNSWEPFDEPTSFWQPGYPVPERIDGRRHVAQVKSYTKCTARAEQQIDEPANFQGLGITVLGGLSNVIVRDGGIGGLTVLMPRGGVCVQGGSVRKLGDGSGKPAAESLSENEFVFDAGVLCSRAFATTQAAGYSGMEFLAGIPGTIGGAVFMNAGAHGAEVRDIIEWVEVVNGPLSKPSKSDVPTEICRIDKEILGKQMQYRSGGFEEATIVLRACFCLTRSSSEAVLETSNRLLKERAQKFDQIRINSSKSSGSGANGVGFAGSAFKNPPEKPAWVLIDEAGCRGMMLGAAMIAEDHANILVNTGGASADDLETLGEMVRAMVYEKSGIMLEWEIKRIGKNGILRHKKFDI